MSDRYWVVNFRAFAFDTQEEAKAFEQKLIDAFCAMPESEGYAASSWVSMEADDADWQGRAPAQGEEGQGDGR
jgi:hypothetical protein